MHELSIAENILEILKSNMGEGDSAIRIKVRVGDLAGVAVDSLVFCFDAITDGTPFRETRLEIERVGVTARCSRCESIQEIHEFRFKCSSCDSDDVEIVAGNELQVVEIEVDGRVKESNECHNN